MIDWNDLKYMIAVAEHGSTLAAGRALRVSQTTVARRLAALEDDLGLALFDKRQAGYVLTSTGQSLLDRAKAVGTAAHLFEEAAGASARDISGVVRVTTSDIYATVLFPPWLAELHDNYPHIRIELDESTAMRDLGAGEADIALRSMADDDSRDLFGRRLCADDWTFYCSRAYAEQQGIPRTREELRGRAVVGGGGEALWRVYGAYLREIGIADQVAIQQGTMLGLLAGIRSGLGVGILPCLVGDGEPDLVRCMPPRRGRDRTLWLLSHSRVRGNPAVATVKDLLFRRLTQRVAELNLD